MGGLAPNFALEGTHGLFVLRAQLGRSVILLLHGGYLRQAA